MILISLSLKVLCFEIRNMVIRQDLYTEKVLIWISEYGILYTYLQDSTEKSYNDS